MEHEPSIASRAHTPTIHPSALELHGDTPLNPPKRGLGETRNHPAPPAPAGSPGNGMREWGHPRERAGWGLQERNIPGNSRERAPGAGTSPREKPGAGPGSRDGSGSRGSCPPAGSGPVPAVPGSERGGAPEAAAPARRPPRRRGRRSPLTSAMSSSPVAPAGRGAPAPPRRPPLTWGSRRGRGLRALRGARTTAASGPRARRGPPLSLIHI